VKGTPALKRISPTLFQTTHNESVSALSESSGFITAVSQKQTALLSVSKCQWPNPSRSVTVCLQSHHLLVGTEAERASC